jgi:UDP-N-acetylmuramyl pentapeptide phosphotransferase/UDP-N-acetylglucosamine-1-phosphate transferase
MTLGVVGVAVLLLAAAIAASGAAWVLWRARRGVAAIDLPGERRIHRVPTPRGGGIGMAVALWLAALPMAVIELGWLLPCAVAAVAAVGWWDDHAPLSARFRLLVHLVAGAALALAIGSHVSGPIVLAVPFPPLVAQHPWAALVLVAVALAWSVNLTNFMDGTDGIAALQSLFVGVAVAVMAGIDGSALVFLFAFGLSGAALGFLPFNFPRARVFMGDVASGTLGLWIGLLSLWLTLRVSLAAALVLNSAFLVDTTLTLLSRVLAGRPWYRSHREHLYQWLARSGCDHVGVAVRYAGWNLFVVTPALAVQWTATMAPNTPSFLPILNWSIAAGVLSLAMLLWSYGKRRCRAYHRAQRRAALMTRR